MIKLQGKFTYNKGHIKYTPYNHASYIKKDYDVTIRGIIYPCERIIYIRINDLCIFEGLEYKKIKYQFNKNLQECITYLESNYTEYKIYTSYTIGKIDYKLRQEILSC